MCKWGLHFVSVGQVPASTALRRDRFPPTIYIFYGGGTRGANVLIPPSLRCSGTSSANEPNPHSFVWTGQGIWIQIIFYPKAESSPNHQIAKLPV